MLDRVADGHTEGKHNDLRDGKEGGSEDDVSNGPAVLEGAEDKDQLRDDVDDGANERPEYVDDPQPQRFCEAEASEALECGNGDEEANAKDNKA